MMTFRQTERHIHTCEHVENSKKKTLQQTMIVVAYRKSKMKTEKKIAIQLENNKQLKRKAVTKDGRWSMELVKIK